MIRGALLVAAALAVLPAAPARAAADDPWRGIASAYLVRIDGATRWSSNANARLRPASLTKLMTALLAVDALAPDDTVVVSPRAARAEGVRLGLRAGTRVAADQLLAAALLRSANDACLALAERVAGSEKAFVAAMNARAAALGLADTRFANACGFDADGHYASARDLATLADAALASQFAMMAADAKLPPALFGEVFPAYLERFAKARAAGLRG
jgi:D-alanyl-D-alanine carboxypeptidase (penicillin-binding protein 5/6)